LETAGSVALHWGSLGEACCAVEPDEARELMWLVPTKVFADLLLSVVTSMLTERATRTALLKMYVLTGPRHVADWWLRRCLQVVVAIAGRLWRKSADGAALETIGSVALH
jgi:hypothetical protein